MKKNMTASDQAPEADNANLYSMFPHKVNNAFLHTAISVIGTKLLTVTTIAPNKYPGAELSFGSLGLLVKVEGKHAIIPAANVASVVLQA